MGITLLVSGSLHDKPNEVLLGLVKASDVGDRTVHGGDDKDCCRKGGWMKGDD